MDYDLFESVSQRSDRAQEEENCRIAAIADELERLCSVYETQLRTGKTDVTSLEKEQRISERLAKNSGFWIPMMQIFELGIPGPSGNENDTYVADKFVFKVNNLMNSGSIIKLLRKILLHNNIFPDTAYKFCGFAGFDCGTVLPVFKQARIEHATPATQIMIDTYMSAIGFTKAEQIGSFTNNHYEVWDLVPRNVLIDEEGDIFVVDAEIKQL